MPSVAAPGVTHPSDATELIQTMFYHRCSLMKLINAIILEQGATTNNLLTKVKGSSAIILKYVLYKKTPIYLCAGCVLMAFNDGDDDDTFL